MHDFGISPKGKLTAAPAPVILQLVGDVILAIDDHYLFTVGELKEEISHHRPGINDTPVAVGRAP
jgi:hypothetical protein